MTINHRSRLLLSIIIAIALLVAAAAVWLWVWPAMHDSNPDPLPTTEQTTSSNTPTKPDQSNASTTHTYRSAKGETIKITGLAKGDTITSPLTITGEVPGNWSFEGTFPIDLAYGGEDLISVGSTSATLNGDWMTDNFVSFTAKLTFTPPKDATSGVLIIRNANPSGLLENDDSLGIPVVF